MPYIPSTTEQYLSIARIETVILYSIFFLTGTAVVLPGTLLPLLSSQWGMGDGAAGVFFLCFSVGSSGGSLLARGQLARALAAGCALVAVGALLLGTHRSGAPLLTVALYGCGLGIAMTSISLLRSRRWSERRIAELARLNLIWALGAGVGPAILLRAASRFNTTTVLRVAACLFALLVVVVLLTVPSTESDREPRRGWLLALRAGPPLLLCLIPLTTGIESGVSSWLSSYIMRGGYVLSVTISATTAFGVGLIVSRLVYSHPGAAAAPTRLVLALHPVLILMGIALLMLSHSSLLSVAAAFVTGLGVGPMYPLLLALLLNHNEAGNAGFLAAGMGASVLPMITGAVSAWTHSLRTGLSVLLAAAFAMLAFGSQMARRSRHSK